MFLNYLTISYSEFSLGEFSKLSNSIIFGASSSGYVFVMYYITC